MTRTRALVGVLSLALVASLIAVALLWRDRDDDDRSGDCALVAASLDAEKVARGAVTRMTTYDFRTVDDDFSWVEDVGTENFQENFAGASKEVIELIRSMKARAVGSVVDSAATAADADHVKVLLFVDQEIRSQGKRGVDVDQPRVSMQMVRQDGEWLVDEVTVNNLVGPRGRE